MLTFLLICLWSCLHDGKRQLNSWSICQNNANWHFFTFSPGANDVFIVVVFCGVLFFSYCSFDFLRGGVPILSCPFLYLTSNCCSPICWRAKKKEKKRKWRLVWSYLPGWTTSTHSFHRGRELNSEYNRVWQFVSVLTLGRQNREVLNVFVSSDGGTSNSRRARERESLRHIWVALIIQVKLYLTFFFF